MKAFADIRNIGNNEKLEKIICPKCGREYLPAEIYYPNNFLGKPQNIDKIQGKIESFDGKSMDLEEQYQCDSCDCTFKVIAKVSFKTSEVTKYNMSQYKTPLFEPKLTLFEGE